ncbi:MAG: hypothetical protein ACKOED_11265 [Aestuariivirga sp.]|uniref:hypothetical protein n=1 Tax=Aestuariivirga sp. TaxID=2650926 RepID=UPI0038CF4CB9
MQLRMYGLAILALAGAIGLGQAAAADERQQPGEFMVAQDDSSGSTLLRKIPGIRLLFGERPPASENPEAPRNKKSAPAFDENYYEPQPVNPARTQPAAPAKAKPPAKPAAAATPPMSCEQATSVVSGFGFSSVEAANCSGKLYAFNAKRDGKSFVIKLDPASGELKEVKKLP